MPLLLLLFLLMPSVPFAQAGSSTELGDSTFYNFGGLSGSSQSIGDMEFSRFSNGVSGMRSRIGDMNFYSSSTPAPSGSTTTIGDMRFGSWRDGTSSTHTTISGMTVHTFSNWRSCMSNQLSSFTFANCH
jgi:hypothetical protein